MSRMTIGRDAATRGLLLTRRAALLAPLGALAGCSLWDDWFGSNKKPLPGKRQTVAEAQGTLAADEGVPKVVLPPPVRNAAWPQDGGNPSHLMGHLAVGDRLAEAWSSSIGDGAGYRTKILARPVSADGIIYTMDPSAMVSAFQVATGARLWRFDTPEEKDRSQNVGGGLAVDQGTLYAVNGLAELVALDAAKGTVRWRKSTGTAARSAPTVADGRLFLTTIDDRLLAFATQDGRQLWTYQGTTTPTAVLGRAAPAYADGFVVAGFGSGEIAAVHADSGIVVWTDSLAAGTVSGTVADFSTVRGLITISNGVVYAISVGRLMVALDLHAGRRLWERSVAGQDSPWVADNWIFLVTLNQQMAAINRDDGRVAWATSLPRWEDPDKQKDQITWFGPVLVSDRLIVAGTNAKALAVSPYTGKILGQQSLSGSASLGPMVVAGTVFIVCDDGRLVALR
ncbi:MAG TPA: PQQ-binding-like beta-propeller repeat protein [Acetobacteraceae bacterium]|jgi:outer membrane protein assembly factor BamB|nr:PQQ-binding-like beta-propeller repeat protein [Acetobacteraceae bacterium]